MRYAVQHCNSNPFQSVEHTAWIMQPAAVGGKGSNMFIYYLLCCRWLTALNWFHSYSICGNSAARLLSVNWLPHRVSFANILIVGRYWLSVLCTLDVLRTYHTIPLTNKTTLGLSYGLWVNLCRNNTDIFSGKHIVRLLTDQVDFLAINDCLNENAIIQIPMVNSYNLHLNSYIHYKNSNILTCMLTWHE